MLLNCFDAATLSFKYDTYCLCTVFKLYSSWASTLSATTNKEFLFSCIRYFSIIADLSLSSVTSLFSGTCLPRISLRRVFVCVCKQNAVNHCFLTETALSVGFSVSDTHDLSHRRHKSVIFGKVHSNFTTGSFYARFFCRYQRKGIEHHPPPPPPPPPPHPSPPWIWFFFFLKVALKFSSKTV